MTHINQRRDTAANWASINPVLMNGEVGWERDTRKAKLGDGVTLWNALPYAVQPYDLTGYALLASPIFTGDPKAPTPATADNDTSIATTAFVKAQGYATVASPTFTGDPKAPTPATADNDTSIATTAYVKAQGYATVASPTFTGDPKAPTPATTDNDTSIATTAFVRAILSAFGSDRYSASGITGSLAPVAYVDITFPVGRFVSTPAITVTIESGGTNNVELLANIYTPSAAGFRCYLYPKTGSWTSGTVKVHWIAREVG